MNGVLLILGILAVWRATLLITESSEEGPFGLFSAIRDKIDPKQKTWLGRGIRCVWCVSWWSGLVMALWLCLWGITDWWLLPLLWFGFSGGAIALHNEVTRRR